MRQAVILAPGAVEVRDAAEPRPGPNEVRVRPAAVGICGSDLHALTGAHPWIDLPVVPGHEVAGTIDGVGEGVHGLGPGDAVLLEANLVCGRCWYCGSGRYNLCDNLKVVGCQTIGAMADLFVAPADRFHPVPEGMSMEDAALVEPLSTATHAVRLAGDLAGASVAILGGGSIGLLTLCAARASGAEAIAVTDPLGSKRARASELGASVVVDPRAPDAIEEIRGSLPRRPDFVFDCVANQASLDQAVALALKGGTIVVIGVPTADVRVPLPLLQDRELDIRGCAMYVGDDVRRAIDLIQTRAVAGDAFVTATLALEDAADAFAAARSGEHVKVQILPEA